MCVCVSVWKCSRYSILDRKKLNVSTRPNVHLHMKFMPYGVCERCRLCYGAPTRFRCIVIQKVTLFMCYLSKRRNIPLIFFVVHFSTEISRFGFMGISVYPLIFAPFGLFTLIFDRPFEMDTMRLINIHFYSAIQGKRKFKRETEYSSWKKTKDKIENKTSEWNKFLDRERERTWKEMERKGHQRIFVVFLKDMARSGIVLDMRRVLIQ